MNKKTKAPSKTQGVGFGTQAAHSFDEMQKDQELIQEYNMFMDRLYVQGIQHCIISELVGRLATLTNVVPDDLINEVASSIRINNLLTYMVAGSEYTDEECKEYINLRAAVEQQLSEVDTGEVSPEPTTEPEVPTEPTEAS